MWNFNVKSRDTEKSKLFQRQILSYVYAFGRRFLTKATYTALACFIKKPNLTTKSHDLSGAAFETWCHTPVSLTQPNKQQNKNIPPCAKPHFEHHSNIDPILIALFFFLLFWKSFNRRTILTNKGQFGCDNMEQRSSDCNMQLWLHLVHSCYIKVQILHYHIWLAKS